MDKDQVQKLMEGVGALAELAVMHYNACVNSGAPEDVAIQLTTNFIEMTVKLSFLFHSGQEEEDDGED